MTDETLFTDAELKAAKEALTHHPKARHPTGILGCTSHIQRELMIGYCKAALIVITLEKERFITTADRDGFRRLLRQAA